MRSDLTVLLDSNVLVYFLNSKSKHHSQANKIFQQVEQGKISACISVQNILEVSAVVTDQRRVENPISHPQLAQQVAHWLEGNRIRLIYPNHLTVALLLEWANQGLIGKAQSVFDAYLATTMISNNIKTIVTANVGDFKQFPGIEVVDLAGVSSSLSRAIDRVG